MRMELLLVDAGMAGPPHGGETNRLSSGQETDTYSSNCCSGVQLLQRKALMLYVDQQAAKIGHSISHDSPGPPLAGPGL
ncbi:hypothetical protein RRG08_044308 [Elysia crispata]|uniref:Uncharacterized protein n=1 Tax=Elysia crispata TaxID=231223 RepID=A0AAE0XXL3_9GAST|nr:hypothetical protein RRG08_044308 [Elysia crispata]